MRIEKGATRVALIFNRYTFKFPRLKEWRLFLRGLLANMQERQWWNSTKDERLCPIHFSIPGGFLVVMQTVDWVYYDEDDFQDHVLGCWFDSYERLGLDRPVITRSFLPPRELSDAWGFFDCLPLDKKIDNVGWLDGRPVLIDYGS